MLLPLMVFGVGCDMRSIVNLSHAEFISASKWLNG